MRVTQLHNYYMAELSDYTHAQPDVIDQIHLHIVSVQTRLRAANVRGGSTQVSASDGLCKNLSNSISFKQC